MYFEDHAKHYVDETAREHLAELRGVEPDELADVTPESLNSPYTFADDVGEMAPIVNGIAETSHGTFVRCSECGTWHDAGSYDAVSVDNLNFCGDDCAHDAGYERCETCGEWSDDCTVCDDGVHVGVYCSDTCAENDGWERCICCDEWRLARDTYETADGEVCETCYEEHYVRCEDCDEVVHYENAEFIDGYGYCCESCAGDHREPEGLNPYGWTPAIKFYGDTRDNTQPYLGVELETDESNGDRCEYVKALCGIDLSERIWLTADSSLNNGVEVTSHPMTLEEHVSSGLWSEVRDCAISNGFTSHDAGTCGLHVHVNRSFFGKSVQAQDAAAFKLTRLLQRFETQMTAFARRTDNHWCTYKTIHDYTEPHFKKRGLFQKANDLKRFDGGTHCKALNMQHSQTFEFRIFRGTLRLETLYASFALVNGMCRLVKRRGESWCEHVAWYELVSECIEDCEQPEARAALAVYIHAKGLD